MQTLKLKILVGTMSDTAYCVAEHIALHCAQQVAEIEVIRLDDDSNLQLFEARPDVLHLICCSTFGSGELPDNAQALYADFDVHPRYLGGVRYGVIALGDSVYGDTFAQGGQRLDDKLQDLGASRLGEILQIDASASNDPEHAGATWAQQWLAQHASH
jgi:MioC protein